MPYADPIKQKQAQREYYLANKARYAERTRRYKQSNLAYVRQVKESNPCVDCGCGYPYYVMDFHHSMGDKEYEINHMCRNTFSLEKIKEEIAKCVLLCANCHRLRTHSESL